MAILRGAEVCKRGDRQRPAWALSSESSLTPQKFIPLDLVTSRDLGTRRSNTCGVGAIDELTIRHRQVLTPVSSQQLTV